MAMCGSWLNLVWYKSSSRCQVSTHWQLAMRLGRKIGGIHYILDIITSLPESFTICITMAQYSVASATLFNKFCITSKKCTQWPYHLP